MAVLYNGNLSSMMELKLEIELPDCLVHFIRPQEVPHTPKAAIKYCSKSPYVMHACDGGKSFQKLIDFLSILEGFDRSIYIEEFHNRAYGGYVTIRCSIRKSAEDNDFLKVLEDFSKLTSTY